jgi:hypothetical protein
MAENIGDITEGIGQAIEGLAKSRPIIEQAAPSSEDEVKAARLVNLIRKVTLLTYDGRKDLKDAVEAGSGIVGISRYLRKLLTSESLSEERPAVKPLFDKLDAAQNSQRTIHTFQTLAVGALDESYSTHELGEVETSYEGMVPLMTEAAEAASAAGVHAGQAIEAGTIYKSGLEGTL